jgi:hypothetical protein
MLSEEVFNSCKSKEQLLNVCVCVCVFFPPTERAQVDVLGRHDDTEGQTGTPESPQLHDG